MGLLDFFKGWFHPEIIQQYKDLIANHRSAVRLYCEGGYSDPNHRDWRPSDYLDIDDSVSYQWKCELVDRKEQILNWYLENQEYLRGCKYADSHPYGLTIELRAKCNIMPKDAPSPCLPEWGKLQNNLQTSSSSVSSSYRQIPFRSVTGREYLTINWENVKRNEEKAREWLNKKTNHIKKWKEEQGNFEKRCFEQMKKILPNWGCYYYGVSFSTEYKRKSDTVDVRQLFFSSFCTDTKLNYTHFESYVENRERVSRFLSMNSTYNDKYVSSLIDYILALGKETEGGLTVLLGDSGVSNKKEFNDYHLNDFVRKAEANDIQVIQIDDVDEKLNDSQLGRILVVVEVVTENEHLRSVCSRLFESCSEQSPLIVYVSLIKEYSSDEMNKLIERKNKLIEEEERKRREKEEKLKKAAEERVKREALLRLKRRIIQTAESKKWPLVKGVHHYFFYYYYPTRFDDVTDLDWEVRKLIWDFKDGTRHDEVCKILTTKLKRVYGDGLDLLTFVCIPASTREVHSERYESFMADVCRATGMTNGYDYIDIVKEKEPSHLGGDSSAEYSYDEDFFNGRRVILFDDVVTRGRSLAKMKEELEDVGAHIVAALSIGKTYSDYYDDDREPHPWILEN